MRSPIGVNPRNHPACRECQRPYEEHLGPEEVCPDQHGRVTFETHYLPEVANG